MTLLVDGHLRVIWETEATRHFFGLAESAADLFETLVHDDDHEALRRALGDAVANPGDRRSALVGGASLELRIRHRSGRFVVVEASIENHLGDPEVGGIVVTLRRVPNRRHLDRAVELLADGGDFSDALRAIASYFGEEMGAVATSITTRITGRNIIVGTDMTTDDHPLVMWNDGWGPLGPGKLSQVTSTAVADLPIDLAGPAVAFGATWVVSLPVFDVGGGLSGAIVTWVPYRPLHPDLPDGAGRFATRLARLAILQERSRRSLLLQARTDPLTGLANRSGLDRVLENASEVDLPLALVYCDLDRFKEINDRWGHGTGDDVLIHVATCIEAATRADDVSVRMGGDEFVVVCPRVTSRSKAEQIVQRLRARVEQGMCVGDTSISPVLSIGLAVAETMDDLAGLLSRADAALYSEKKRRRGRSHS